MPIAGETITCDTSLPNPDLAGVKGWGIDNVTVHMLTGSAIQKSGTEIATVEKHGISLGANAAVVVDDGATISSTAIEVDGIHVGASADITVDGLIETAEAGVSTLGNSSIVVGSTGQIVVNGSDGATGILLDEGPGETAGSTILVDGQISAYGDGAQGIFFRLDIDSQPTVTRTVTVNGSISVESPVRPDGYIYTGVLAPTALRLMLPSAASGESPADVSLHVTGMLSAVGPRGSAIGINTAQVLNAGVAPHVAIDIAEGAVVSAADRAAIYTFEGAVTPTYGVNTDVTIAGKVEKSAGGGQAIDFAYGTDNLTLLPTAEIVGGINLGSGTDALILNGASGTEGVFDFDRSPLQGVESFSKQGQGAWTLTGSGTSSFLSGLTGPIAVNEGTLLVDNDLSTVSFTLATGAAIGGAGQLGALVLPTGGSGLTPGGAATGTLTIDSLVLAADSRLAFDLGTPDTVGGDNDLIVVDGDLTLDGVLDVTALSNFGNGLYTLIQYGNLVADNGLVAGDVPAGYAYDISAGTLGTAGAVTVLVSTAAGGGNQFWDGSNTTPGSVANGRGGTGNWDSATTNWTNQTGTANAAWGDEFAIFGGTAGTVTVIGSQTFTGMQFFTDGYSITGDSVARLNAVSEGATINVASGLTATIGTTFTGGAITKTGAGTLAVTGDVVDELDAAGTWAVEDGELFVNGQMIADSWTDDTAIIVRNGATLTLGELADIGSGAFGSGMVVIDGQGKVIVEEGSAPSHNFYVGGTASDSTVRVAGTLEWGSVWLEGAGNYVEVTEAGQIVTPGGTTSGVRFDGNGNTVVMNGVIEGTTPRAILIFGDANTATVGGLINTIGDANVRQPIGIYAEGDDNDVTISAGGKVWTEGDGSPAIWTVGDDNNVTVSGLVTSDGGNDDVFYNGQANAIRMHGNRNVLDIAATGEVSTTSAGVAAIEFIGGSTVTVAGTVSAADASETAIVFRNAGSPAINNVILNPGYAIDGLVVGDAASPLNNLVLGGDGGSDSFDVSAIGDTAQFRNFGPSKGSYYKSGNSVWTLTGTNDTSLASSFQVWGGTLLVNASMTGTNFSNNEFLGVTLGGSGSVGYIDLFYDATLSPGGTGSGERVGTLTASDLYLDDDAVTLAFDLGTPNVIGGTSNDLIVVTGDLALNGVLDVTDTGGFGNGLYTLIQYGNLLANYGLNVGDVPAGYDYELGVGTVGSAGEVTLLVSGGAGGNNQFWDGANPTANGVVNGGPGNWDGTTTNWTDVTGTTNSAWGDEFAIFGGTAGTVNVIGARTFTGMQVLSSGYNLIAGLDGQLNAISGGATINVADAVTSSIYTPFTGGAITKTGAGWLIVGGDTIVDDTGTVDTWSVNAGGLRIDGDFAAGSWSDNLALVISGGAAVSLSESGRIDQTTGSTFQAIQIEGQGQVTIDDGGFVGGSIGGTANSSSVQVAGTMSTSLGANRMIVLLGSDNLVEVSETGQITTDSDRGNGIRLRSGDDNRIVMNGTIHTSGNGAAAIQGYDGNGFDFTVGGEITTEGARSGDQFAYGISVAGDDSTVDVSGSVATLGNYATGVLVIGSNSSVTISGSVSTVADFDTVTPSLPQPHAVQMEGVGNTLEVLGSVSTDGAGVPTVKLLGGTTVTLSGTVSAADAGETAILFGDGGESFPSNSLELRPGFAITGLVLGDTNAFTNTLIFGGDSGSDSFDVSNIGDAAQFRTFGRAQDGMYKSGGSTWTLTGVNDSIGSFFRLQDGILLVDGSMAGTGFSNLSYGAGTLGGAGTVGYIEMLSGGTVAPGGVAPGNAVGTLTTGSLSLDGGATLAFDLGAGDVIGGTTNDLIVVTGNLTLDGTLDITDAGGFGNGLYTLIQYGNLVADNGLAMGATPDTELTYVINAGTVGTGAGAVLLTVSGGAAGNVQYWDGPNLANGGVEGGTGTWNAANTNWTNATGTANEPWAGQFAIFSASAGTVTIEGEQAFTGTQFLTSGYELAAGTGGELVTSLADTRIRIGTGIISTFSAPITGGGGLAKQEAGTLVLAGANDYTGTTAINGGTLRAAAANTLSAESAHVVASGAVLDLDGHDQIVGSVAGSGSVLLGTATLTTGGDDTGTTFSGMISGSGWLTKTGTGTLILTGANTYAGLTTIDDGTLQLGDGGTSGSVTGNIVNDAALVFDRSDDLVFGGVLSGTGTTRFDGPGMTTLTASSAGFSGTSFVSKGNLRIAAGGALGTSLVTVEADGTLSGLGGIVGDVSVLGTLAPGATTLGMLTVDGNVSFAAGATFGVRIAANGENDLMAATTASLDGSVAVSAIDAHTSYVDGQTYTILATSEADGVSGTFDGATMLGNSAFLTPTLSYNDDTVMLTIGVTADFTIVAETYNQRQAAGALNELGQTGDALTVFNELAQLDADEARMAFDLTSGEVHAAGQHLIDQTFALFSRTLRDRARGGFGGEDDGFTSPVGYAPAALLIPGVVAIDGAIADPLPMARAWVSPLGGRGEIEADGNASEFDWALSGLSGGYEGPMDVNTGHAWAGFGFGYLRSGGTIDALLSTLDAEDFSVGIYGGWNDGAWSMSGSLAYMASSIETSRTISFGGVDRIAAAEYWAHSVGASGEVAYGFDVAPNMTLSPLATIDVGFSGHDGFTETGAGALNLIGDAESWRRFDIGLGVALAYVMPTEVGTLSLEGRVVWEHAFADATPSQTLSFDGSPASFSVKGPDAASDRLHIGAGLSLEVSDDVSVTARYDGRFSADQFNHAATLGLNIRF